MLPKLAELGFVLPQERKIRSLQGSDHKGSDINLFDFQF